MRETFKVLYDRRHDFNARNQAIVDGYTNFIFRDLQGMVYSNHRINNNLKIIQREYNKEEQEKAREEHRETFLLPDFTCHHLRHTFCTRIIESGALSIKSVRTIMGHVHPDITLRVYAAVTENRTKEEQDSVMDDLRILLGDKGENLQFPAPDRKVESKEIEDYVEAIRALMRSLIHEASDIASWVCVRKYMDGYTLDQMIEEQPQVENFIIIMDALFDKNIGIAHEA